MNKKDFLYQLNKKIDTNKISLDSLDESIKYIEKMKKIKRMIDQLFNRFYRIESEYLYYNNQYRSDICEEKNIFYKQILGMRNIIENINFEDLFNGLYIIECDEKYTFINHNDLLFDFYKCLNNFKLIDIESYNNLLIKKFSSKKQSLKDYLKDFI